MEAVSGVRLAELERGRVKQLVELGYYLNSADFLRDAVRSKLKEFEFVIPRKMPIAKIKAEVLKAIKAKPDIYADEIAAVVGIDIETSIKAVDELIKEKKVSS